LVEDLSAIFTTLPGCPASGVPGPAWVILTLAALPGADSTISVAPDPPAGPAATTPCSVIGAEPLMNAPGEPEGPPDTSSTAVTGTLAVTLMEPGKPLSDGNAMPVVSRPSK